MQRCIWPSVGDLLGFRVCSLLTVCLVLWSVAGLSAFRFLGATWFLIVRLVSLLLSHCESFPGLIHDAVPRCINRNDLVVLCENTLTSDCALFWEGVATYSLDFMALILSTDRPYWTGMVVVLLLFFFCSFSLLQQTTKVTILLEYELIVITGGCLAYENSNFIFRFKVIMHF